MKIEHNGTLMRIFVAESQRYGQQASFQAIVDALATAGICGATVFKGIEGFGSRRHVSSNDIVDGCVDLPILIEVADEDEKIRSFLPALERILGSGLVTLERVQTLLYRQSAAALS